MQVGSPKARLCTLGHDVRIGQTPPTTDVRGSASGAGVEPGMVEPRLGLRLVRGPDWCRGDQDGGEGFVGTVVEVGEGGRSALVQWDGSMSALYRCGEDGKFDLRVFDAAPAGSCKEGYS